MRTPDQDIQPAQISDRILIKINSKNSQYFRKLLLTNRFLCDIIFKSSKYGKFLGVAQLVARYLGVVEAASSSLVTQTISSVHNETEFC